MPPRAAPGRHYSNRSRWPYEQVGMLAASRNELADCANRISYRCQSGCIHELRNMDAVSSQMRCNYRAMRFFRVSLLAVIFAGRTFSMAGSIVR
jgi:hypothetical protein